MPQQHASFCLGEVISIESRDVLERIQGETRLHADLTEDQFRFADCVCHVKNINYFHGGLCLYKLSTYVRNSEQSPFSHEEPVPGIWEEVCLRDSPNSTLPFSFPPANEIYVVTHETRNSQPVVVVKSKEDIEYLVFREYSNRALSELMTEVSLKRTSYGFEKRYSFSGTAHDTVRDWVLQKR